MRWILVVVAVLAAGCASDLRFTKSDALDIVAPAASGTVRGLPVRVTWGVRGDAADAKLFAVFLDRSPIAPGRTISSLVPDTCRKNASCNRADYLQRLQVFVTPERSFVFDSMARRQLRGRDSTKELHTVTVVVLDRAQSRVGELYATRSFIFERQQAQR